MKFFTRATFVLLLLSIVTVQFVAIDRLAGDPARTGHVSRPVSHPAAILAMRYRGSQSRTTRFLSLDFAKHDARSAYHLPVFLIDRPLAPRSASTFPPYWSSLHLSI